MLAYQSGTLTESWWWLTSTSPPSIEAALPNSPLRSTIQPRLTVLPPNKSTLTSAQVDDLPLSTQNIPLTLDTSTLPDGPHTLHLTATDTSLRRNKTTLALHFTSDNTPPSITLDPNPPTLKAGQPLALRLTPSESADLTAAWDTQPLPLTSPTPLALLAAPITHPGGQLTLTVHAQDPAGNTRDQSFPISIEPVPLPRQDLLVPPSLAALATGPVATAESAQVESLTRVVNPQRLWDSEFRPPLIGIRTTGFGDRRDYADGFVSTHSGYDVAAPERTPVLAVANGAVVFAAPLQQRGTALILDHGWGVYSLYAHLSEFRVQPGDNVTRGQTVALVGNTGLSTGPHLHWEIRLRGQPIDPDSWIALSKTLP